MVCPKCNNNVDDSAVFCNSCGTPINSQPVQAQPAVQQQPVEQIPVQNVSLQNVVSQKQEKKKVNLLELVKKNKKNVIIIAAIIAALIIFTVISTAISNGSSKKDPTLSTSFFIRNKDYKYALFNENGKQLSKFIYSSADDFFNGVAIVQNEEGEEGVINEKGKTVVSFGKYEYLSSYGSLFKATEKDFTYSILNKKGKKIISRKAVDVHSFIGIPSFIIVEYEDNKYEIYNYNGKKIKTLKASKDEDAEDPSTNSLGQYTTIYYDGTTWVINMQTAKVITKIKEDKHYCLNNITEDEKTMTLNSCSDYDETTYKVIKNKKVYDLSDKCDKVSIDNNLLVCKKDSKNYLLNNKMEPIEETLSDMAYQDYENYAIKDEDGGVNFIKKGKKVKSLADVTLSDRDFITSGLYLIYKDGKYKYFDLNGDLAFDASYKRATNFDANGLAKVSEDGDKYYYINTKGKKVSEEFDSGYLSTEYYSITDDSKKGVMDKKGKMILDCEYDSVDIRSNKEIYYAYVQKNDKYELYNLKTKKVVLTNENKMSFYDHYVKITDGDKVSYYTYKGKLLFEE